MAIVTLHLLGRENSSCLLRISPFCRMYLPLVVLVFLFQKGLLARQEVIQPTVSPTNSTQSSNTSQSTADQQSVLSVQGDERNTSAVITAQGQFDNASSGEDHKASSTRTVPFDTEIKTSLSEGQNNSRDDIVSRQTNHTVDLEQTEPNLPETSSTDEYTDTDSVVDRRTQSRISDSSEQSETKATSTPQTISNLDTASQRRDDTVSDSLSELPGKTSDTPEQNDGSEKTTTEPDNASEEFRGYISTLAQDVRPVTPNPDLNNEGTQSQSVDEYKTEEDRRKTSVTGNADKNPVSSETSSLLSTHTTTSNGAARTDRSTVTISPQTEFGSSLVSTESATDNKTKDTTLSNSTTTDNDNHTSVDYTPELFTKTPSPTELWNASSPTPILISSTAATVITENTSPESILFEDFLGLTTENVSQCLETEDILSFSALSGEVSFSQEGDNGTKSTTCTMIFTVPSDLTLSMLVSINSSDCYQFTLSLHSYDSSEFYRHFYCTTEITRMQNRENKLELRLRIHPTVSIDMYFNFTAVPPPRLETEFTTATTGYVQTPGWDGHKQYPKNMDSWAQLDVPTNYSVLVSMPSLDIEAHYSDNCGYDHLTIYVGERRAENETIKLVLCNDRPALKPTVFHTHVLSFHFFSDRGVEHTGFRLFFSFHQQSALPTRTANGKWNCSVPFWPQFQLHFNCNLVQECDAGEDEADCHYQSETCGHGLFSIGTRCYIFVVEDEYVTWNEAANECLHREAYLASLNSPEEWNNVFSTINELTKRAVYVGLHTSGPNFPQLYRKSFQWSDQSAVFYFQILKDYSSRSADCSVVSYNRYIYQNFLSMAECDKNMTDTFLCEKDSQNNTSPKLENLEVHLNSVNVSSNGSIVVCPSGHFTFNFLACDVESACWASQSDTSTGLCDAPLTPPPPSMSCLNGVEQVPYTLVCDHRPDCSDNSDENFCVFPSCRLSGKFQCANKQCVPHEERCDRVEQCLDSSDERQCPLQYIWYTKVTSPPPALVQFDGYGSFDVLAIDNGTDIVNSTETGVCPDTHFACPGNFTYCMPVFVRCNGVFDCPGREDEMGCDHYECPGYYRCRASTICVHADNICDGVYQCPQHDDELLCHFSCPTNCTCLGLAFYCVGSFPAEKFPDIRFLDAHGSRLNPEILRHNSMLVYLNIADCELKELVRIDFPNLRILNLSKNRLTSIMADYLNHDKLLKLSLNGNPLTSLFVKEDDPDVRFLSLYTLDLSNIFLPEFNLNMSMFPQLAFLNLSGCGIERLKGKGFHALKKLKYLDLDGCPMRDFPADIFANLDSLKEIWADNYKLCCPSTLPTGFHLMNCHSPSDEISSCDALLRSNFYRVFLSVFAALALLGNLGSFVYRVFVNKVASNLGFGVFVTHLCVSDFLMGIYLAIIGVADRLYQGTYLWNDVKWKRSAACKVAGFLSLLSSEVSAFIICLITLDRFLVLRFPFSNLHFRKKSAHVACLIVWLVGIILAGIPLLPVTAHWQFYSQNGICIPLPVTRNDFAGHDYSFAVIVIVNFVLFLLIAAGQVFIYWSIRTNSMAAVDTNKKSNDLTVARRLITIAMSDFLCWFPIGLLGLLASNGVPIPGEVNVAMAIIILPVNSAINPFLYTINMMMERRRRTQERRIQKMVMSTLASKYSETAVDKLDDSYTKSEALTLISTWLTEGLLSVNNLEKILSEEQQKQESPENKSE